MAVIEVTDESFRDIYQKNEIVILDFWAIWCNPCHQFKPIFDEASDQHSDILFGTVETEVQTKLSGYFGIRSIPTIIIIREQLEVFRFSGVLASNDLKMVLAQARAADMDEVRKKIEEEDAEPT